MHCRLSVGHGEVNVAWVIELALGISGWPVVPVRNLEKKRKWNCGELP